MQVMFEAGKRLEWRKFDDQIGMTELEDAFWNGNPLKSVFIQVGQCATGWQVLPDERRR